MYIPRHFELRDDAAVRRVIEDYGFALLVAAEDGVPEGTHIPLLLDPEPPPRGRLLGHLARANGLCQRLESAARDRREVLAVFQGPHAYVSPNDYGPGPVTVPTWNYVAVHVYGVPRVVSDAADAQEILVRLTATYETGRTPPWSPATLDPAFTQRMLRGIMAFEIAITHIQAKAKLSQNRTPEQAAHAAARLEGAADPLTQETGRRMRAAAQETS